ncbi:prepilin peptidase [Velocimicrobium porci]|uniref:Prepilin type IV endopeptidase peptidase domain-containing protein n=1 Tax=Velocimicrobium porci TaxID=2606634 RepID=A0A6L5XWD7_9FIRM|nr:prepilin peptidase [Velocimicrobium porci]MSS63146.1 hypothetical protein [Velocimicrobium porci]
MTIGLLIAATVSDLRSFKVKNLYIIIGFSFGLFFFINSRSYQSFEKILFWLSGMILPILLLWLLFRYKVIGAGDIKLFSVIGGLYGPHFVIRHMILALFCGALLSIIHFIRRKDFRYRLSYFMSFISRQNSVKQILFEPIPYYKKDADGYSAVIPFTLSILAGYILCYLKVWQRV